MVCTIECKVSYSLELFRSSTHDVYESHARLCQLSPQDAAAADGVAELPAALGGAEAACRVIRVSDRYNVMLNVARLSSSPSRARMVWCVHLLQIDTT